MATNYFVSYDLNGQRPAHAEMDQHLAKLGSCVHRVLETVWYVRTSKSLTEMYEYVNNFVSPNDRVLIIEATDCWMRNLLVPVESIQNCWRA